jgi:hypothetical protein
MLGLRGVTILCAVAIGLAAAWWALDRRLRRHLQEVSQRRVVRVITIAPTLQGPYRSSAAPPLRIDETDASVRRLRLGRRILAYALGTPLVLLGLVLLFFTPLVDALELFGWMGDFLFGGSRDRHR